MVSSDLRSEGSSFLAFEGKEITVHSVELCLLPLLFPRWSSAKRAALRNSAPHFLNIFSTEFSKTSLSPFIVRIVQGLTYSD